MTTTTEALLYAELLKAIGIPTLHEGNRSVEGRTELKKLAELNKIGLLYSGSLSNDLWYRELVPRYELLINTLKQITAVFNKNDIAYSIFKTLKPFPTTPSDIDVLLTPKDFRNAEALLISTGYTKIANDAYTSTLTKEMNVDLQLQPSVSNLPYLSKTFLMQNSVLRNVHGFDVRAPTPEAEIIVIASHSLYKEQMFTLNDYYTITILAEQVNPEHFLDLARKAKVLEALRVVVGLCAQLTETIFGSKVKISEINHVLGSKNIFNVPTMPLKFPFSLVIKLLAARAGKDEETRRMILPAIIRLASPGQLRRFFAHMTRSTY